MDDEIPTVTPDDIPAHDGDGGPIMRIGDDIVAGNGDIVAIVGD